MIDRRKRSPWGMVQAVAAVVALSVSLAAGVYTRVTSDVMSDVNALASSERLIRAELISNAVDALEKKFDLKVAGLDGNLKEIEDAVTEIELSIAVIQQQQIEDKEVRKLVNAVNTQLAELRGDIKVLNQRSVSVEQIADQLGSLSNQVSDINEKLKK